MRRIIFLLALFCCAASAFAADPADKVQEGIALLNRGDLEAAGQAFAEAEVALPENQRILFNRACVYLVGGDWDKAVEFLQKAALSRDEDVAIFARYNLGAVASARAMQRFGETPEEADKETREEGIDHLLLAAKHYRECISLEPEHEDARYNLELIRLWIKHMEAVWKERDRDKAREEMDLLQFLAMIEEQQTQLRAVTLALAGEADSPRLRQALKELEENQLLLSEEIEPLKEKIQGALQGQPQAPPPAQAQAAPDPDSTAQALTAMLGWADEAREKMEGAASLIQGLPAEAPPIQKEVLDSLNRIFEVVAPYDQMLSKAIQAQQALVDRTVPLAENSEAWEGIDFSELQWPQERVGQWSQVLGLKAAQGLEQPAQAAAPAQSGGSGAEEQQKAMEALRASMEKAVELCPRVVEASAEAAGLLQEKAPSSALPKEEEALSLLKEIAEPLPKQDPEQNQDGDQNQDQQDQENQQDQQQGEQQQENRPLTKEEAEALLQKAKEREREHQEKQERLQNAIAPPGTVDKDW